MRQDDTPPAPRLVNCPGCQRQIGYSLQNPWRPFCSERCRNADLGAWASERYRVAAPPVPEDDDDPHPEPGPLTH